MPRTKEAFGVFFFLYKFHQAAVTFLQLGLSHHDAHEFWTYFLRVRVCQMYICANKRRGKKATCCGFGDVKCACVRPGSHPRLQKLFLSHSNTLWHLSLLWNYQSFACQWHRSTTALLAWLGECCARMPGSRRLWEETSELMSWALLCLFVFFYPPSFFCSRKFILS